MWNLVINTIYGHIDAVIMMIVRFNCLKLSVIIGNVFITITHKMKINSKTDLQQNKVGIIGNSFVEQTLTIL